ncbi:cyclodeaminase/cyclohydrolase family protein [Oscillospiraceae bacterium LTW-04]|nr:cyclodeaminase/cyclohydrolase family protein [Oscillospiraceae bacterium MB24-C1]
MEMKNMTLEVFCATTASNEPAPGGGSVAALAGALAASLAEMVAQLTVGKKGYEAVAEEMTALIPQAAALRNTLLDDITRDSTSFNAYMEALALPKNTDEEKAVRRKAMQDALKKAAEVPLSVAQTAAKIMPLAAILVKKGNANAVTDGLVSAMMTRTAVLGALLNVKINLGSIKDESYVSQMREKIQKLETEIISGEATVLATSPLEN